jgi:nicotinamide-nucleotide amidase
MFSESLLNDAELFVKAAGRNGLKIALAESCTGGLLSGLITSISGSSAVLERSFVTYSNEAKADMLGVPVALIASYGAVSEQVAIAMAEGGLANAPVQACLSITGIAGPNGGSAKKPVGLVHFCLADNTGRIEPSRRTFANTSRQDIRLAAVEHALQMLNDLVKKHQIKA